MMVRDGINPTGSPGFASAPSPCPLVFMQNIRVKTLRLPLRRIPDDGQQLAAAIGSGRSIPRRRIGPTHLAPSIAPISIGSSFKLSQDITRG